MVGSPFTYDPIDVPLIDTEFRTIKTALPVPESLLLLNKMHSHETRAMHGAYPMIWEKAYDFQVEDPWGNKWIDFTSTIFVTNSGHGNKRIIKAIEEVLKKPLLHTYNYASKERVSYLEYLLSVVPKCFDKAFLLSSGTEATEVALKLMRLAGQKRGKQRPGIICFEGAWHGRTLGAQMMSHNASQKQWIGYHDPNIFHLPFPYPWIDGSETKEFFLKSLNHLCITEGLDPKTDIAGFMLETFQGWGAIFYPKNFIQELKDFCLSNNALMAFDEMQAGFGRTGQLFGFMHYDIEPDIICCGKGASSSLPLSLVLGQKAVMDLPEVGSMSSTHSANPMVCAVGEANLRALIEDGYIENGAKLGIMLHDHLNRLKENSHNSISHIFGKGLVAGVVFSDYQHLSAKALCDLVAESCFRSGLLVVHTGRESIKLAPPLSISVEAMLEGLSVFADCVTGRLNEV